MVETSAGERKKIMKIREVAEKLNLKVVAGQGGLDREVTGGYMGDMLSVVMAQAPNSAIWLTVQNHPNLVAVAVLFGAGSLWGQVPQFLNGGQRAGLEVVTWSGPAPFVVTEKKPEAQSLRPG